MKIHGGILDQGVISPITPTQPMLLYCIY